MSLTNALISTMRAEMYKYDIAVLRFARDLFHKLDTGDLKPGFGFKNDTHIASPDFTADQCCQLVEIMYYGGYSTGFFPCLGDDAFHILISGKVEDPIWPYRPCNLFSNGRTEEDVMAVLMYTLQRPDLRGTKPPIKVRESNETL